MANVYLLNWNCIVNAIYRFFFACHTIWSEQIITWLQDARMIQSSSRIFWNNNACINIQNLRNTEFLTIKYLILILFYVSETSSFRTWRVWTAAPLTPKEAMQRRWQCWRGRIFDRKECTKTNNSMHIYSWCETRRWAKTVTRRIHKKTDSIHRWWNVSIIDRRKWKIHRPVFWLVYKF